MCELLRNANITISLAKCEFAKATMIYIGRIVAGWICWLQAKVEATQKFPVLESEKELMQFYCSVNNIQYNQTAVFVITSLLWWLL